MIGWLYLFSELYLGLLHLACGFVGLFHNTNDSGMLAEYLMVDAELLFLFFTLCVLDQSVSCQLE